MFAQINQYWFALDPRERSLLKVLGLFLSLVLVYLLIWSPIQQSKIEAQQKLQAAQQEWQWLNQQIPAVEQSLANRSTVKQANLSNQNALMSLLQGSLRQQNLFKDIKTLKGVSQGGKVSFEKVNATRIFRWLAQLEQQGLSAYKLNMNWLEPGMVAADIEFRIVKK